MKALRKWLEVLVVLGLLVAPATLVSAHSGNGLDSAGLVKWIAAGVDGKVESWSSLFGYAGTRLVATAPGLALEVGAVLSDAERAHMTTPCSDAFLAARVKEKLQGISNRLEGNPVATIGPEVGTLAWVPQLTTGADTDDRHEVILIYGDGFGSQATVVRVYVTHAAGIVSLQNKVQVKDKTLLQIDLPSGDPLICNLKDAVLKVSWGAKELFHQQLLHTPCLAIDTQALAPPAIMRFGPQYSVTDVGHGWSASDAAVTESAQWRLEAQERPYDGSTARAPVSVICANQSAMAQRICKGDFVVP